MRPTSLLLLFCALFAAADAVKPCDRSLIRGVAAEQVNYDSTTKTLTCKHGSNSLMAIDINNTIIEAITCDDVDGWKDGSKYENASGNSWIAEASAPINLECYEYCAVERQRGVVSRLININGSQMAREVTCEDAQQLIVDDTRYSNIYCEIGGWSVEGKSKYHIITPLKVECKRGCTQGDRTDITMSLSSVNASKTMFECNKPEVNGTTHGVSVSGTVYPYLECDSKAGYTYKDAVVADAFAKTDMQCDILPEPTAEPEPEPPAPGPPTPNKPTNEEQTSDDEDTNKAMVIIGCMGAALVIVIILIVIMCIKRRKDEEEEIAREERHHRRREERKKEERRREEESRTESEDVSNEV
ncbi:hypothetical protein PRIPAC_86694 [Pristionchus pacificus]|uniref:Uncharacterized protein n=1 Tax=Pristionchus pacificus TaxID=54126 RepID=A0A2A6BL69_PRIPA|nr:hypothetical protein PRIPAC_86694 [Pristionchus pacificus]|eukprot:PDM66655.1 hypothetical protein PRIPAC_48072 [Pristionchus pacificus]